MTTLIKCITSLLILICSTVQAKQIGDSLTFSFSGRLKAVTRCVINNDNPIEVHFGKVGITNIDKGIYIQDIPYSLNCGIASKSNTVMLEILATPETWDEKAMSSDMDGLGAYILKDRQPISLNTLIPIADLSKPPQLQAKLIKKGGAELLTKNFTVSGTIIVEYL